MDDQKLRQSLERLHGELDQAQPLDPSTRELLRDLQAEIQSALDAGQESPKKYRTLRQLLADSIGKVEQAHPGLALTIGQVLDHLAQV